MVRNINFTEFNRMMSLIRPRVFTFWLTTFLIAGIYSAHHVILAFLNARLLNGIISRNSGLLWSAVELTCLTLVLACVTSPLAMYWFDVTVHRALTNMRLNLFSRVQALPMSYLEQNHSGNIVSTITVDINRVEEAYRYHIYLMVESLLYGVGSAVAMFVLNWQLAVLMVILGTISAIFTTRFSGPLRSWNDKIQASMASLTGQWMDMLNGFRLVKVYDLSATLLERFGHENQALLLRNVERARLKSQLDGVNYVLSAMSLIGVFLAGTIMAAMGRVNLGTVLGIITLQNGVSFLFLNFSGFFSDLQSALAGSQRIFEILDSPEEPPRYHLLSRFRDLDNAISLHNLSFSYDGSDRVLDGITFGVREGQVAAIVGPSGSGKSTLFKLLLGFYPPSDGTISIHGKTLSDYPLVELRKMIGYVPQDAFLFPGTLKENIAVGRPGALMDDIVRAATLSHSHDFIAETAAGYDTVVGDGGIQLSGGQRQRIAIARAILRDAPILLLDEATSALDQVSESLVQQAITTLMEGRTTLVIAHRLATINNADLIVVLRDGCLVELGTHQQLLGMQGLYSSLYRKQLEIS